MPQESLPTQALLAKQMGEYQLDDLELDGPIKLKILGGIVSGLHSNEMINAMEDCEVWRYNLELLPPNPYEKAGNEEKRRKTQTFRCGQKNGYKKVCVVQWRI